VDIQDSQFWALRQCMRDPVAEIFHAAFLLDLAVGAHLADDKSRAASLFRAADMPAVRAWTESLWGSKAANPEQWTYHRYRKIPHAPPHLPPAERVPDRDPSSPEKRAIVERYGRHCMFCGIPLIRKEVRHAIQKAYPDHVQWDSGNNLKQHAAFQCMWMQFDHVLPHSRGGDNSIENVIVTCAPCNYGRGSWTLAEVGLEDPRERVSFTTSWDGIERFSL
jgi:5-methylcytosine-specific restriction endonuclease McrA